MSFQPHWLGLADDAGLLTPFGLFFTFTGGFTVCAFVRALFLEGFESISNLVAGIFVILLIGGGHMAGGTLLLLRDRVWLDNRTRSLLKITGWLGIKRRRMSLAAFDRVDVVKASPRWFNRGAEFAVVLAGSDVAPFVVAYGAKQSIAEELRGEIEAHLYGRLQTGELVSHSQL